MAECATLQGDLGPFLVTEVLQFLQLSGASGTLECQRAGERISIGMAHGRPAWASSSGRIVRTGDVLIHRHWATPDEIETAVSAQRSRPGVRIGALLREAGIPDDRVGAAVGEVFRRLVCLLSLWPDGRFHFVADVAHEEDVALDVELERLILEGLLQADLVHSAP